MTQEIISRGYIVELVSGVNNPAPVNPEPSIEEDLGDDGEASYYLDPHNAEAVKTFADWMQKDLQG